MRLAPRRRAYRAQRRTHLTICPKRPAGAERGDGRLRNSKVKRGRPRAPLMKCGWGCGEQLTRRNMRAHFTICAKRLAGSGEVERRRGNRKASADARRGRG
jgi:hypothetical protein